MPLRYNLYRSQLPSNMSNGSFRSLRFRSMRTKHQDPRLRLLYFWLGCIWPDPFLPEDSLVSDLIELDRRYRTLPETVLQEYDRVLAGHPHSWIIQKPSENPQEERYVPGTQFP